MKRSTLVKFNRDGVYQDKATEFWHCRVDCRDFGPWRFRGEAEAAILVEQRRAIKRRERLTWTNTEIAQALNPVPDRQRAIAERDQFRMRFAARMASATLDELGAQHDATKMQLAHAKTAEEKSELGNGLALVAAVIAYRFGS